MSLDLKIKSFDLTSAKLFYSNRPQKPKFLKELVKSAENQKKTFVKKNQCIKFPINQEQFECILRIQSNITIINHSVNVYNRLPKKEQLKQLTHIEVIDMNPHISDIPKELLIKIASSLDRLSLLHFKQACSCCHFNVRNDRILSGRCGIASIELKSKNKDLENVSTLKNQFVSFFRLIRQLNDDERNELSNELLDASKSDGTGITTVCLTILLRPKEPVNFPENEYTNYAIPIDQIREKLTLSSKIETAASFISQIFAELLSKICNNDLNDAGM